MNLNTLDMTLRTLSASEKKYQKNPRINPFEGLETIRRGNQDVFIMYASSDDFDTHAVPYIKKQSRFIAVPPHVHDWIEINYMYSGSCRQIINENEYILNKGQVILIDTDTVHSINALGENDIMISLVISKSYLNTNFFNRFSSDSILSAFFINAINNNTNHNNFILFHAENSRTLPIFFCEMLCEIFAPSINSSDMVKSFLTLFLCELINIYEHDLERQELDVNKNSISPILRYIEGNFRHCTLKETAEFFNMNPNYLTTLLKQRTGFSYKELIQKQRMMHAARLLSNTTLSITEIANNTGYENVSFFYKKFKAYYQCSPKEYRLMN